MKKIKLILSALVLISTLAFVGCQQPTTPEKPKTEADIKAEKIAAFDKMFMEKIKLTNFYFLGEGGIPMALGEISKVEPNKITLTSMLGGSSKNVIFEYDFNDIIEIPASRDDNKTTIGSCSIKNVVSDEPMFTMFFPKGNYFVIYEEGGASLSFMTPDIYPLKFFTKETLNENSDITPFIPNLQSQVAIIEYVLNSSEFYTFTKTTEEKIKIGELVTFKNGVLTIGSNTASYVILREHPTTPKKYDSLILQITNSKIPVLEDTNDSSVHLFIPSNLFIEETAYTYFKFGGNEPLKSIFNICPKFMDGKLYKETLSKEL